MTRRVRDPEAKRSALLDAAAHTFALEGFAGVSTGAIARHAGVSEGTLFHHFGSKHGLLEATTAREVGAFVGDRLHRGGDVIDWEGFIDDAFTWVAEHRMIIRLWDEQDDRVIGSLRRGMERGVVPPLTDAIEAAQTAGHYRDGDPRWFAQAAFAVVGEAFMSRAGAVPRPVPPDAREVARIVHRIVAR